MLLFIFNFAVQRCKLFFEYAKYLVKYFLKKFIASMRYS